MSSKQKIIYLGPEGTFAFCAAEKRFAGQYEFVPATTIRGVFDAVSKDRLSLGVVPIENSSGGTIYETVNQLVDQSFGLFIQESLSMNVKLALLGKNKEGIQVIYSHFAPLVHCENWLRSKFPNAQLSEEKSTATAVMRASKEENTAAIGTRDAAKKYNLTVLEFPIGEENIQNITQFFVVGHEKALLPPGDNLKTSFVVVLPNEPGGIVNFLEPFKDEKINLSRIISRPIWGQPEAYVFLIDIVGTEQEEKVKSALKKAGKVAISMKNIGSYPVTEPYSSE
jgi:prephenate dehydratase